LQLISLVDFLSNGERKELGSTGPELLGMKYRFSGYRRFLDPDGYPAIAPPWGTLNAINLNTGEYMWKINLGEFPELAAMGIKNTGTENYGGRLLPLAVSSSSAPRILTINFERSISPQVNCCGKPCFLLPGTPHQLRMK